MLTLKLHILLNILAPCWCIFTNFYNRDSFDDMIKMRATTLCTFGLLWQGFFWCHDQNKEQQPYANFKTAHFDKYLGSMLTDSHETSITGILSMRWLEWGQQPYTNFKTAHFGKYLRSMLMDFHKTSMTRLLLMG